MAEIDPLEAFMSDINATIADTDRKAAEKEKERAAAAPAADDEVDPLDAFMSGLASTSADDEKKRKRRERLEKFKAPQQTTGSGSSSSSSSSTMGERSFDDDGDGVSAYMAHASSGGGGGGGAGGGGGLDAAEFDAMDPALARADAAKRKIIDPLPPVDHDAVPYEEFWKEFYTPCAAIVALDAGGVAVRRRDLNIKVRGADVPCPITSFAEAGFDAPLSKIITKQGFSTPTPIQSQALPAAMSGRDVIGIAKTGSGKTMAFVWPMLVHIMDQRVLEKKEGPIGLVLAPTHELAHQIYTEARKFAKVYDVNVCAVYGGASKWEQKQALMKGAEIVVATPGRMIDMVKNKSTNLTRVTYLVLDEADRMFDMGFEVRVPASPCQCAR